MLLPVAMSGPRVFPCPRVSLSHRHGESGLKFLLACPCWLAQYTDAPAFSLEPSPRSSPTFYVLSPCRVVSNTLSASSSSVPSHRAYVPSHSDHIAVDAASVWSSLSRQSVTGEPPSRLCHPLRTSEIRRLVGQGRRLHLLSLDLATGRLSRPQTK